MAGDRTQELAARPCSAIQTSRWRPSHKKAQCVLVRSTSLEFVAVLFLHGTLPTMLDTRRYLGVRFKGVVFELSYRKKSDPGFGRFTMVKRPNPGSDFFRYESSKTTPLNLTPRYRRVSSIVGSVPCKKSTATNSNEVLRTSTHCAFLCEGRHLDVCIALQGRAANSWVRSPANSLSGSSPGKFSKSYPALS